MGWSEPCWPVWGSLDGEVGSIFGCDRILNEIRGLVLRSWVGDSTSYQRCSLSVEPRALTCPLRQSNLSALSYPNL